MNWRGAGGFCLEAKQVICDAQPCTREGLGCSHSSPRPTLVNIRVRRVGQRNHDVADHGLRAMELEHPKPMVKRCH